MYYIGTCICIFISFCIIPPHPLFRVGSGAILVLALALYHSTITTTTSYYFLASRKQMHWYLPSHLFPILTYLVDPIPAILPSRGYVY